MVEAVKERVKARDPTLRETFTDFVAGLPEGFVPPAKPTLENVVFDQVEDRPEHARMFPENGGLHVSGVSRYPSGFRNWHDIKQKT